MQNLLQRFSMGRIKIVPMSWNELKNECFAEEFPDIGGWSFSKVFDERKKFVRYSQIWTETSGIYKKFKIYCKGRLQHEQRKSKSTSCKL